MQKSPLQLNKDFDVKEPIEFGDKDASDEKALRYLAKILVEICLQQKIYGRTK